MIDHAHDELMVATPANFDESRYLAANPDVARAVDAGEIGSGRAHFEAFGVLEGRPLERTSSSGTTSGTTTDEGESSFSSIRDVLSKVKSRGRAAIDGALGRNQSTSPSLVRHHPDQSGEWWELLPFSSHRVEIAPNRWTRSTGVEAKRDARTAVVLEQCGGTLDGQTVIDLGCLEGGFAIALAAGGAERVVGVEAREISVRRCELVRDLRGLDNVHFVVGDVEAELASEDRYSVVFAAGILYHVDDPARMLRAMRKACTGFALIDTHVADRDVVTHDCSELTTYESAGETYTGRWFREFSPDDSESDRDGLLWAARRNTESFWPLEDELTKMATDAGFSTVDKIDMSFTVRSAPWTVDQRNRVVYIARI